MAILWGLTDLCYVHVYTSKNCSHPHCTIPRGSVVLHPRKNSHAATRERRRHRRQPTPRHLCPRNASHPRRRPPKPHLRRRTRPARLHHLPLRIQPCRPNPSQRPRSTPPTYPSPTIPHHPNPSPSPPPPPSSPQVSTSPKRKSAAEK